MKSEQFLPKGLKNLLNSWRSKRAVRNFAKDEAAVSWLVDYDIPNNFSLPQKFDVKNWKGLVYCLISKPASGNGRLHTVWQSHAQFEPMQSEFRTALGILDPVAQGYFRHFASATKWYWNTPATVGRVVVGALAIFGAIRGLQENFAWLLEAPRVYVSGLQSTYHVVAGSRFRASFALRNLGQRNTARASIESISVFDSQGKPSRTVIIDSPITKIARVEVGKDEEYPVSGDASNPGQFELVLAGFTKSGEARHARRISGSVILDVIADTGNIEFVKVIPQGKSCQFRYRVRFGNAYPSGLRGSAELLRQGDVVFVGLSSVGSSYNETDDLMCNLEPGNEATSIRWLSPPVAMFDEQEFGLWLESKSGRSDPQWRDIASKCKPKFSRR